jgi:RNA polymerase sigma factor (sigma-70 family)
MAESELERHRRMSMWVAREILPHEDRIRGWFRRNNIAPEDIDEVVQEAYCRIAKLDGFDLIASPPAYFFSIARNVLVRRLRRPQVVSLETIMDLEALPVPSELSMEEGTHLRHACRKVLDMIAHLPERCRRIVELRKIEGWSQKEIAAHLGITEKAVEKQVWLGVRAVREAWDRKSADCQSTDGHDSELGQSRLEKILP